MTPESNSAHAGEALNYNIPVEVEMKCFDSLPLEIRKRLTKVAFDKWAFAVFVIYKEEGKDAAMKEINKSEAERLAEVREELLARIRESKREAKRCSK